MSGFIGGLTGSSSPPQLVVFSQLDLTKGSIRGVKVLATIVSNATRLLMLAFNKSQHAAPVNWTVYLSVSAASFLGVTVGSWIREGVNKEVILWCLYWLLWLSSGTIVGAFEPTATSSLRAAFALGTVATVLVVWACYVVPERVSSKLRALYRLITCECFDKADAASAGNSKEIEDTTSTSAHRVLTAKGRVDNSDSGYIALVISPNSQQDLANETEASENDTTYAMYENSTVASVEVLNPRRKGVDATVVPANPNQVIKVEL